MPVVTIEELAQTLEAGKTLVGLDLGEKTLGLSVSDAMLALAHPRPLIRRVKFTKDAEQLIALIDKENIGGIVMGLPVNMDGTSGPRVQASKAFIRNFAKLRDLPVLFWDERLSTVAAERALLEMDVSRAKRSQRIDSAAATFILQGVLDRLAAIMADQE
ncbi:Holliday junction resolvase RuvX [Limoniibacter endophyticus]|uniref:Putative pre-16S rRNA nuclease n=1 Tax=Limoniibacter endophyticus TaxID=1565040 RepID=A0A8J3GG39_9HYPH|nr:Holliday junction resolvase RuvX [Limoniibacter endophyticus]GHC62263.1 putative pre-16S rRNA nuclease [Limoniibacter endophyticus]